MSGLCTRFGGIFTLKRNAPSLLATRAETRLTVYRAPQVLLAQQRGKFTSKVHADFPDFFAQNLEYLAALWSDLDEKLSRWS